MSRPIREIFAHTPHHIVQRGCRREKIFFDENDFRTYVRILDHFSRKYTVEVWCHCLMDNHIHLILYPQDTKSISKVMCEAHRMYSEYVNNKMGWKGNLWEKRFSSYPMDMTYTFHAVRYILRNPITANMVAHPEDYRWSSARSLIDKYENDFLGSLRLLDWMSDWKEFIYQPTNKEIERELEENEKRGKFLFKR